MLSTILIGGWPLVQVLLAGGLILAAVVLAAVQAWRSWPPWWLGSTFADDVARGADDPAPAGVVEYARDLEAACEGADAEFCWEMLTAGATRDQARAAWIAELLRIGGGE